MIQQKSFDLVNFLIFANLGSKLMNNFVYIFYLFIGNKTLFFSGIESHL